MSTKPPSSEGLNALALVRSVAELAATWPRCHSVLGSPPHTTTSLSQRLNGLAAEMFVAQDSQGQCCAAAVVIATGEGEARIDFAGCADSISKLLVYGCIVEAIRWCRRGRFERIYLEFSSDELDEWPAAPLLSSGCCEIQIILENHVYRRYAYRDLVVCRATAEPVAVEPTSGEFESAVGLRASRAALRPVEAADLNYLHQLCVLELAGTWRFATTLPVEGFESSLSRNVEAQFCITSSRSQECVGIVQLFGVNLLHGYGFLAVALDPTVRGAAWPFQALALFLEHVFCHWPLRRVYIQCTADVAATFSSAQGKLVTSHGKIRDGIPGQPDGRRDMLLYSVEDDLSSNAAPSLRGC